jgi:hypothetical protein
MKLEGLDRFKTNLRTIEDSVVPRTLETAMGKFVLKVQNNAMDRTPVKTGNLRSSYKTKVDAPTKRGILGYVRNTAEYAPYVHERTELKHDTGEAKFLHNAIMAERHELWKQVGKQFGLSLHHRLFVGTFQRSDYFISGKTAP